MSNDSSCFQSLHLVLKVQPIVNTFSGSFLPNSIGTKAWETNHPRMHDSWIKNLGMVNREQHCNTSNPYGILCSTTLVLSLNEPATKGKLILKKKIASLLQLGDIKLKGHRHIKLKFFELVRNRENMRGLWVSLFRRFCGRSKVE